MINIIFSPIVFFSVTQLLFVWYPLYSHSDYWSARGIFLDLDTLVFLQISIVCALYYLLKRYFKFKQSGDLVRFEINPNIFYLFKNIFLYLTPVVVLIHGIAAGGYPLIVSLGTDDLIKIAEAREAYGKTLNIFLLLIFTVFEQLIPMFMIVYLTSSVYYRKKDSNKRLLYYTVLLSLLISMLGMAKILPVVILFLFFSTFLLARRVSPIYYLIFPFFLLVMLSIMGLQVRGQGGDFDDIFIIVNDLIFRRMLSLTAEVFHSYFDAFPVVYDHLYGRGIRLVSMLLLDFDFQLPNLMYKYIFDGELESGWANTAYLGQLWADFSYFGLILGPVFLSYFIFRVTQIIEKRNCYGEYAFLVHIFSLFILGYLSISSLFSSIIIFMLVLVFALKFAFVKVKVS